MEFWGVEVKAGEPLKVQPEFGSLVHISQASLGEDKDVKGAKNIYLRLKVDNKDFVIGSLSAEDRPQLMFDLVFEKQFELSHDLKSGSVYFMGYIADDQGSDLDDIPSDDSEDVSEDEKLENQGNVVGKPKAGDDKASNGGVAAAKAGKGAKAAPEPVKEKSDLDDDEDDGSEDDSDDDDDEMALDDVSGEDSDEEGDDSSEEEEPTPKQSKKRPPQQAPVPATKKAKSSTPDKTGKKNGKNVTPVSSSPGAGKAPIGKVPFPNKSKQSPKSGGPFSGKSGNKFNAKNGKGKRK